MAQEQASTVDRGKTFFGPTQTITTTTADWVKLENGGDQEGLLCDFPHIQPPDLDTTVVGYQKKVDDRKVKAVLMRNQSGITMFGGMAVTAKAGYEGKRFDGYSATTAAKICGFIDDHIGLTGVRNGDLCWVIYEGPVYAYTAVDSNGFVGDTVGAGDVLYALTAAAATATTTGGTTANNAGRFANWAGFSCASNALTTAMSKAANSFARAISAATSGETNTKKLINVFVGL